jgi:endonuclease-3
MRKIERIISILNKKYKIKPWRDDPFKVLISCILSQRTKDEVTREASEKLFKFANAPEKILKLSVKKIESLIYPVGFYKQKAKRIKKVCKILIEKYNGKVPNSREELLKLPGVGFKTADVVLSYGYGKPVIAIDTHVFQVARRLGLTKSDNPEKIREDLHKIIPEKFRLIVNLLFVEFGKEICRTIRPKCEACPIKEFCEYYSKSIKIC